MLLTMEQAYKESYQAMPNPERIDKVTSFSQCCGSMTFWCGSMTLTNGSGSGSARCSLLRDENFSCSLNVRYGGFGICKLQFLIEFQNFLNYSKQNSLSRRILNFLHFLVIKTLDLDPHWQKMLDPDLYPDPLWNKCGSATLVPISSSLNTYCRF